MKIASVAIASGWLIVGAEDCFIYIYNNLESLGKSYAFIGHSDLQRIIPRSLILTPSAKFLLITTHNHKIFQYNIESRAFGSSSSEISKVKWQKWLAYYDIMSIQAKTALEQEQINSDFKIPIG